MLIQCGYEIGFQCGADTPLLLMLHIRPERQPDLQTPENFRVDPYVPWQTYTDSFGNVCTRMTLPPGITTLSNLFTIADSGFPDPYLPYAQQHAVEELPDDVIVYLLGSRYCDTDKMSSIAWALFGDTAPGWQRVQAIVDYVHNRIRFDYQQARSDRTGWDAHCERVGVCRDFAHLAITLCRCMNIPARYCTGYLGDIGVPQNPAPMDFSAWCEVYLGGAWHTFDARHNTPRIGRVLMARGRDATDAAISTAFGSAILTTFKVITEEIR
ncbi:MAG TPA: transglutaminase family protein [Rhizomicrobium sp.]|jgi:transglutaminase-like putative cysteine protease|nr:transglutaminase family protein [Rhizomicrobium sp.]